MGEGDLSNFWDMGPSADLSSVFVGPPADFAGGSVSTDGATGDAFRSPTYTPGEYGAGSVDLTPATNGGGGFSIAELGKQIQAGGDTLLGLYKDWNSFQLAGQQLQIAQQNQKLNTQVTMARNDAAATVAKAQADAAKTVATAQAQQQINAAQIAAANAKGQLVTVLPSQKLATYATIAGLAVAVYAAFKRGK